MNVMTCHPVVHEIHQFGPKWWKNRPIDHHDNESWMLVQRVGPHILVGCINLTAFSLLYWTLCVWFSLSQILPCPDAGQQKHRGLPSGRRPVGRKQEWSGSGVSTERSPWILHPVHSRETCPLPPADARDIMDGLHPLPVQKEVCAILQRCSSL